jgi:hypothetical protein
MYTLLSINRQEIVILLKEKRHQRKCEKKRFLTATLPSNRGDRLETDPQSRRRVKLFAVCVKEK